MCDSLCGRGQNGMVFAKNSDRPIGEVQLAVPFGRRSSAGGTLRTQYLSIGDTGAHATFLSIPTWLWGAEHGINEYGVAIGNERVSTRHDAGAARPALIGMDLVRLGLERARSADEAVDVVTELLTTHGQGGIADAVHGEAYDSSFLIADGHQSFVLETSGTSYAAAPFPDGAAISNRLSLGPDWISGSADLSPGDDFDRYRDPMERTIRADIRLAASRAFLAEHAMASLTAGALAAHLRDHGEGSWGEPGVPGPVSEPPSLSASLSGSTVCMHTRDRSVTAASLIAVLPNEVNEGEPVRAYVALGSPCVSIYIPAFPRTVAGPPPFVPRELSTEALWRAADALRVHVESHPEAIVGIRAVLNPIEDELWAEADGIFERPDQWGEVGERWGQRALDAITACLP